MWKPRENHDTYVVNDGALKGQVIFVFLLDVQN